jgi:magnesium transporter
MSIKTITEGAIAWHHIETVTPEIIEFLRANYNFHSLDLEDVMSESTHIPKLDTYKDYLFLVLHFPHWNHAEKKVEIFQMDFFVGKNYLISIQHGKNKEMRSFFFRCLKNRKIKQEWMNGQPGFLLYNLIAALFKETRPILNNIGKHISLVEQEVFSGEQGTHLIKELARHRRNVLMFGSIIEPQRYIMSNLAHTHKPFLNQELRDYFDDVRDHLDKFWAIIEAYKENVHGLYITVESIINQRTSKVLTILTVISAALLPTLNSRLFTRRLSKK